MVRERGTKLDPRRAMGEEVPGGSKRMAGMKNPWLDLTLLVLASPILLVQGVRRGLERYRFFQMAMQPAITCECGAPVALVGFWKCSCGFTYQGHLLRTCPVCGTIPCVVRCYQCGVTTKLPEAS